MRLQYALPPAAHWLNQPSHPSSQQQQLSNSAAEHDVRDGHRHRLGINALAALNADADAVAADAVAADAAVTDATPTENDESPDAWAVCTGGQDGQILCRRRCGQRALLLGDDHWPGGVRALAAAGSLCTR